MRDSRKTPPSVAIGSAPAKLILFGEHSVADGQLALGVALSRGVRVELRSGSGLVRTRLTGGGAPEALCRAVTPEALVLAALGPRAEELDTEIEIGVPPLAGFGTSAAIAVALLRAKSTFDGEVAEPDALLDAAIRVEDVAHGTSSGLDPAICLHEGVIRFRRAAGGEREVRRLEIPVSFHLVVGVFGSHGGTGDRVRAVRSFRVEAPALSGAAMRCLGASARAGARAFSRGKLADAGRAVDVAHGVLNGLGLVGDDVERMVRVARRAGALGAKMSGAGGAGGAFFALAPDSVTAVAIRETLEREGAVAWIELVGT